MSEVIHLKGSGGGVWEMTLPLQPAIAKQFAAGNLARVNPDGSPCDEPAPKPVTVRRKPAAKPSAK